MFLNIWKNKIKHLFCYVPSIHGSHVHLPPKYLKLLSSWSYDFLFDILMISININIDDCDG